MSEKGKYIMKIFIIFPKDSESLFNKNSTRTFGGASVQMYNIAKELCNYKSIETYSIIPEYKNINFDDSDKFKLIKVYNETDNILVKFVKFFRKILIIRPHVIIQHGLTTESCILALLCWLLRIKFIFMFAHDVEVRGLRQSDNSRVRLFRLLLRCSYQIITQNKYQEQTLLRIYKKNSLILYNGFEIKEKFNIKNKEYVLWVARCDKWKQPELFIELAKQNNSIKFVMICPQSSDKEYYDKIVDESKKIKNLKFINFVSYDEIERYFKKAMFFVNTSLHEGFPQTFIQSLMFSTPVISLNVNPDEIITKYECGIYCGGNFEIMNKKLKKAYSDEIFYQRLSKNAFNYASKFHNIKNNVKELLSVLEYKDGF